MKYQHHDLIFEVEDLWLSETGINEFTPKSAAYKYDAGKAHGRDITLVKITDIAPLKKRAESKGVFCDNCKATAKERVFRIFKWFITDAEIEPVKVTHISSDERGFQFKYRLIEGSHRFHCSIVAGFVAVPATLGTDIYDL